MKYIQAAHDACKHVHVICPLGSANRANSIDLCVNARQLATSALIKARVDFDDKIEEIQSNPDVANDQKHLSIIKLLANVAKTAQAGNCQEMAAVAFLFLMEKDIYPLELVSIPTHTFVVIGRNPETLIDRPESWNEEAIICDPWRRENPYDPGLFSFRESMIYSPLKLREYGCEKIAIGYAILSGSTPQPAKYQK